MIGWRGRILLVTLLGMVTLCASGWARGSWFETDPQNGDRRDARPEQIRLFFDTIDAGVFIQPAKADDGASVEVENWWLLVAINRTMQFISLLLAVGFALFSVFVAAPVKVIDGLRWKGVLASIVAALTYALAVNLGGAEMIGGGVDVLFNGDAWRMGMMTTLATSLWLGIAGLAILVLGFIKGFTGTGRKLIILGVVGSVSGLLVTGHAATADPRWFMSPIVALHLLCGAFWLGSLLPLIQTLRVSDPLEGARVLKDFSFWAVFCVLLIIASGAGISFIQVERLAALIDTDYGIRLLIKWAFVVILLGLAGINKLWLTPALEQGNKSALFSLRRFIWLEILVILSILVITTSLSLSTPPRALEEQSVDANLWELRVDGLRVRYAERPLLAGTVDKPFSDH